MSATFITDDEPDNCEQGSDWLDAVFSTSECPAAAVDVGKAVRPLSIDGQSSERLVVTADDCRDDPTSTLPFSSAAVTVPSTTTLALESVVVVDRLSSHRDDSSTGNEAGPRCTGDDDVDDSLTYCRMTPSISSSLCAINTYTVASH